MSRRVAIVLLAAGAAYRLVLILLRVPTNDGDESIIGLMATHIAEGRDFPAYFYGQHYMGALEAYLAAPVVGLFGPTVLALRLPMVLAFYVATGWLLYRLTVRLYTPWFATAVTGLYALGSDHIVSMQLRVSGGYPEMDLLGVLLVLLAVMLAERPRTLLFGLWGLVAGLVVWDTWLPLPYLAASAGLLVAFRGVRWVPAAAAGFVVGAAPMIAHVAAGNDVLGATLHATAAAPAPLGRQLYDAVVVGVPVANGLCPTDGCHPVAGIALTVAYLALLAVAGWLAARALRGEDRVRQAGRLTLVAAAGLAILLYAQSPAGAAHPLGSARYLHMLPVSLPAVL